MTEEKVILVNEKDEPVGLMEKIEAHRQARLHRAFSVFIFDSRRRLMLQKRADGKYHSAGLWTNTCCGHPREGEDIRAAATRRLNEEMGFRAELTKAFDFIYHAPFGNGLTEHEFDHVFVGVYDKLPQPHPDEVSAVRHMPLADLAQDIQEHPENYSAWLKIIFPRVDAWAREHLKEKA